MSDTFGEGQSHDAGSFAIWLAEFDEVLSGTRDSVVACGSCNACCKSKQFIHIEADERATLRRIPKALQFHAPGLENGTVVLGYDEHGHCPMLVNERCSIYDDRPRACRAYDCRVLAATKVRVDADKPLIQERVDRWRFRNDSENELLRAATIAAAQFLETRRAEFPNGTMPVDPTQRAIVALIVRDLFVGEEASTVTVADVVARIAAARR